MMMTTATITAAYVVHDCCCGADGTVVGAVVAVVGVVVDVVVGGVVGGGALDSSSANTGSAGTEKLTVHEVVFIVNGTASTHTLFTRMYGAILLVGALQLYFIVALTVMPSFDTAELFMLRLYANKRL